MRDVFLLQTQTQPAFGHGSIGAHYWHENTATEKVLHFVLNGLIVLIPTLPKY